MEERPKCAFHILICFDNFIDTAYFTSISCDVDFISYSALTNILHPQAIRQWVYNSDAGNVTLYTMS